MSVRLRVPRTTMRGVLRSLVKESVFLKSQSFYIEEKPDDEGQMCFQSPYLR